MDVSGQPSVFVGGLPRDITQQTLNEMFSPFGTIVKISTCRRGYAFIDYATAEAGDAACSAMDGMEVEGRALGVRLQTEHNRKASSGKGSKKKPTTSEVPATQEVEEGGSQQPKRTPSKSSRAASNIVRMRRPEAVVAPSDPLPSADELRGRVMYLEQQSRTMRSSAQTTATYLADVRAKTANLQARLQETQEFLLQVIRTVHEEDVRIRQLLPPGTPYSSPPPLPPPLDTELLPMAPPSPPTPYPDNSTSPNIPYYPAAASVHHRIHAATGGNLPPRVESRGPYNFVPSGPHAQQPQ